MPRPKSEKPAYCRQKSTSRHAPDRAFVTIDGERVYLGEYGTQESRDQYDLKIAEWIARGRTTPAPIDEAPAGITIAEMVDAFIRHGRVHYKCTTPIGARPTGELGNHFDALRPLLKLYAMTPAASFGPNALRAVRELMISAGVSRKVINRHVCRIRHVFRWAASHEMIQTPDARGKMTSVGHLVVSALETLDGLQQDRTAARETKPVGNVPLAFVEAVYPFVNDHVETMIRLQLGTGMRAGEVCQMRTCDIDRSGKVWVYRPQTHKTAHHGHKREIFIGPKSQKVLAPFLKMDLQAYVFSPADAEAARHAAQHEAREKPPQPSQMLRMQRAASRRRRRPPGEKYDVASYRRAITRACVMASELPAPLARQKGETVSAWKTRLTPEQHAAVKTWRREHHWHPHQLRHNFATEIRRDYGADVELVLLGDKVTRMADVYGAKDRGTAERVIAEVG